jgi:hypothetical protein
MTDTKNAKLAILWRGDREARRNAFKQSFLSRFRRIGRAEPAVYD